MYKKYNEFIDRCYKNVLVFPNRNQNNKIHGGVYVYKHRRRHGTYYFDNTSVNTKIFHFHTLGFSWLLLLSTYVFMSNWSTQHCPNYYNGYFHNNRLNRRLCYGNIQALRNNCEPNSQRGAPTPENIWKSATNF